MMALPRIINDNSQMHRARKITLNLRYRIVQRIIVMIIAPTALWCSQSEFVYAQPFPCRLFANGWFAPGGRPCMPARVVPPIPTAAERPNGPPLAAPPPSAPPMGPPAGIQVGP
jgi:hypothetical protein